MYIPKRIANLDGVNIPMCSLDIEYSYRTISLDGEITEELAATINSMLRCLARISTDDIILYIQSPGGSVAAGLSIFDTISAIKSDIVTVASGATTSMAAFLLAAGGTKGKRYAQPNAQIVIHQPLGTIGGQASDIRIHAENMLKTKDRLNVLLSNATGQTVERISADTDRDYIMNADEAKAYGLIDHIGDPISDF